MEASSSFFLNSCILPREVLSQLTFHISSSLGCPLSQDLCVPSAIPGLGQHPAAGLPHPTSPTKKALLCPLLCSISSVD